MKLINVLGTGPSLKRYIGGDVETVGVNKIVMTNYVDHLLIMDRTNGFPKFVIDEIKKGKFGEFHTFLEEEWRPIVSQPMNIFEIDTLRGRITDLDDPIMPTSLNAGYCAAILAYKLGATIIDLYGVDFVGHATFNNPIHQRGERGMLTDIKRDFRNLQNKLILKGASLRVTPKGLLSDFLPPIPQSRLLPDAS